MGYDPLEKKRPLKAWEKGGTNRAATLQIMTVVVCGALVILVAAAPHTVPALKRAFKDWFDDKVRRPLRERHWRHVAEVSRQLPRFSCADIGVDLSELHTHVLTLERTPDRRKELAAALDAASIPYSLFFGQDEIEDIAAPITNHYAGARTKELITGQGYRVSSRRQYWLDLISHRKNGTLSGPLSAKLKQRFEFASKISFLQLMHRMISKSWKYMVVLQDDVRIVDSFAEKLHTALCSLPNDWQVLHFNACNERMGEFVGEGVRQFIEGSCTLGFAFTMEYAISVIYERAPRSDHRFDYLAMRGGYLEGAYIADPPLVEESGLRSAAHIGLHTPPPPTS
uniref:Glycosyltransferase family 25 protein n=1 Tax=Tetraselmis sp. GSL018 TaxID=582737 RepID=A0A061SA96_9CHLO|mmetsp:Transcript_23848/g.56817  ORF Transcript_23848/g.56817 Transcript_23848/m.56817 type:complete len:340 (-) Transcript_23848:346-1365(-)|eukprot:CAMPEP_0177608854 /NCGR_PEP_ID=MMETSP0419_2-20121207/18716_1 /TAXON_ID=582737 /ORGANISM="Tetraselmis sp., Strain GSL018" /LENGTH=339 /DNA_ID=CAMNT_0019103617 /DNA_START=193 /DNA_END=1212 /DNA_ORIENTATION=+